MPPICAIKPYTGHLGAASDIGEIIIAMQAVREGIVPATLNFEETDKEFSSLEDIRQPAVLRRQHHHVCQLRHGRTVLYSRHTGGEGLNLTT